jgi:hypothetical protein
MRDRKVRLLVSIEICERPIDCPGGKSGHGQAHAWALVILRMDADWGQQ